MRTLEEIIKQDYKHLTMGEMREYELGCEFCPLNGDYCTCEGNMVCYGGMPIEPPCCGFEDEDILDEIYDQWRDAEVREERYRAEKEKEAQIKKAKSEERKKKLREYKRRHWKELQEIKTLKSKIKGEQKNIKYIEEMRMYANVINSVNKMFRDAHQPNDVKDIDVKPHKDLKVLCEEKIADYNKQIEDIKKLIKQNEKEYKRGIKSGN